MKKQRLQTFLQKYYLNGLVESTLINCKDKQISTDFITQDRSMLGHVKFNDVDIEDGTFADYFYQMTWTDTQVGIMNTNWGQPDLSVLNYGFAQPTWFDGGMNRIFEGASSMGED